MEELKRLLIRVSDSYYDFVVSMLAFSQKSEDRQRQLQTFIMNHPEAGTSDIIKYATQEMDLMSDHVQQDVVSMVS